MKIALIYLMLGLLTGTIYGTLKHIVYVFKNNLIIQLISDILFCLSTAYIFMIATHHYFYGEIRLHLVAFFTLGFYIERKTLGKLFAKLFLLLYNWVSKLINKIKTTRFGKIIFK